jgi:transposase
MASSDLQEGGLWRIRERNADAVSVAVEGTIAARGVDRTRRISYILSKAPRRLSDSGVRVAIESAGAVLLYLPLYSSDFNPIEMLSAKLKALLRKAAEHTITLLWAAIGRLLDDFSAVECSRYLAHPDTAQSQ